MAQRVVVQIPAGSPLTKMNQEEIASLVEKATSHLPQSEEGAHGDELVIQTAGASGIHPDEPGSGGWVRRCAPVAQ